MQNPEYDQYGGITNTIAEKKETIIGEKKRKGYNLLEKLLLKYSKKINYLLDENGKYKCRREIAPKVIRIGPTNRCTARCFYCPREYIHEGGTGYMDWEMFVSILDWAKARGAETMSFALFGEPLLHPRILDMLSLAKQAGMKVGLSTNAIVMDKELADKIIDIGLYKMEISMDGFTESEFRTGKQVDKYEEAKRHTLYLFDQAKKRKSQTIYNVHFVDIGNVSFKNKINFIKFWQSVLSSLNYMTSFYYEPHNWAGARDDLRKGISFLDRQLARFRLKKPCMYIKGININYNGDVYVCTNDPSRKAIIGNVKEETIEKIYNSEKRKKFLESNESGTFKQGNCNICTANTVMPLSFIKKQLLIKLVGIFTR